MRIGIDVSPALSPHGGVSNYVRHLLSALLELGNSDEFVAYISKNTRKPHSLPKWESFPNLKLERIKTFSFARPSKVDSMDLFHGTNFKAQAQGRHGYVLTIHDLWLDRFPQYSKKLLGQPLSFKRTRERVKRASRVIAVSQFTAQEVRDLYGVEPEKITTIHHGVSNNFFPDPDRDRLTILQQKYHLPSSPYILFVGGADPRKNHRPLFQAFAHNHRLQKTYHLVAVGNSRVRDASLHETCRTLGISEKVSCIEVVPKEDLRLLYSHADVFVFPSRYEGFGFPVLEAMACGVPVITSRGSALPEVAGDAALFFDPNNVEELGEAISCVLENAEVKTELRTRGPARAKQFSWEQTALKTMNVYRDLAG
ncbi:MAG: glycosyltransferase family 1 protein [Nitrospirae bacterium]|nr:glycosyltransferase family 1 protein [Nitrospirota bacterium]